MNRHCSAMAPCSSAAGRPGQRPAIFTSPLSKHLPRSGQIGQARGRHVALRLNNPAWGPLVNKVLLFGGSAFGGLVFGGGQQAQDSVEIYDPATGLFSSFGTMTKHRQNHTATELDDGRILITGGAVAHSSVRRPKCWRDQAQVRRRRRARPFLHHPVQQSRPHRRQSVSVALAFTESVNIPLALSESDAGGKQATEYLDPRRCRDGRQGPDWRVHPHWRR